MHPRLSTLETPKIQTFEEFRISSMKSVINSYSQLSKKLSKHKAEIIKNIEKLKTVDETITCNGFENLKINLNVFNKHPKLSDNMTQNFHTPHNSEIVANLCINSRDTQNTISNIDSYLKTSNSELKSMIQETDWEISSCNQNIKELHSKYLPSLDINTLLSES